MLSLIPENISPFTLVYYEMRTAGFISNHGRPWSIFYSIFQLVLTTIFGILAVLEVLLDDNDIKEFIVALSTVAIYINVNSKLMLMMSNGDQIREILNRLEKYRKEILEDENYRNQIIEADNTCRKHFKYYNSFFLSFPVIAFVANFINDYSTNFEEPHLVHKLWIPWNLNEFWNYTAAAVFVFLLTMFALVVYTACGAFQLTFTFQLSAYLKILQNRLETKGAADKTIYRHHKIINQFLKEYNELFCGQLFIEIMVASLEPCGFGYAIVKGFKRNDPAPLGVFHNLILCLLGPFIMCYCGQEISSQMERLHESSYMSNWYGEKPKVRRDLYTMMLVTIRPLTLNYRLFITFNFECFATIIQGVYSYLMMINNFETAD